MRLLFICVSFGVLAMSGCSSYPRYRTGGAELPVTAKLKVNWKTADYIRLGLIFESYLGKPYKGKSLYDKGIDCSLFTQEVFKKYNGTLLPRTAREQFHTGREIARRHLLYGDLVFFRTEHNRVSHVGIYVGHDEFIHASSSKGVIITSMLEKYWSKRYAGARRITEQE